LTSGIFGFETRQTIIDALSGASIMPFLLMFGSAFSTHIMRSALETNRIYMAIGCLVGLIALLGELLRPDLPK